MNKSGIRSFFIILFLVISSFFNVGSSSFVVEGEAKQENITINEGSKAVCYNARTGTKYTTIEKALSVAKDETAYNDTIYVIPGTNPTITSDCEIASGDTLCLPYEGETYKVDLNGKSTSDADFSKYYSGYFADENESNNLKSNVFILGKSAQETTTLTISGTLLIGGILGVGEGSYQKPTGHTMGSYSQVTLTKYSHIVNKGKIECRGYIKPIDIEAIDYCSLINESGSETNLPFVIYDYRGGSYSAACKLEGVFPFNVFDLPNCHVTSIYNSGSTLKVIIHASANNQIYSPDSNAILLSNNDGLFRLSSGSVSFQYKPAIFNRTTNDCVTTTTATNSNILNISIDGTISLSSMTITLAENSVNTADFYLPFSYKFNIDVKSGSNLNIENKVKFLSGSYLHINEGATVNTNASIVFYQVYNGRNTLSDKYPNSLGPSVLINDGEMNINSSFGGKIGTTLINAKINTGSSFSATTTSREVLTGSSGGLKRTYFDITNYAYCSFFISDSNTIQDAQLLSSNSYTSLVNNDNGYWTGNYGSTTVAEVHGAETEVGNSPCFESGTLISTNRGLVEVENLKQNDLIKSYNHELGIYEYKPIAAVIDHGQGIYNVIRLDFSDGSNIGFITCHGLFDLDKNRYVNIDETNYLDYIGHRFAKSLGDEYEEVTLTNATIGKKFTHSYTVLSSENINCEANGLLNITSVLEGIYNIFEYDLNHNFDSVLMQQDIEKYGLYTYDDFRDRIDEKKLNDLGFKYFKVSIGKGLLTDDILQFYIDWFFECIRNGEAIIY